MIVNPLFTLAKQVIDNVASCLAEYTFVALCDVVSIN